MMEADFVLKKSLIETLRAMKVGDSMVIKTKDFKISAAKTTKYRLLKKGINLNITEKGMIDEYKVTRLS